MKAILTNFVLLATLVSCGSGTQLMPNVSGKAGEVIVVMDKANWEGDCGSNLRLLLGGEFPFLPQPEPAFNLINIPETAFSSIFQSHRNIIITAMAPELTEGKMVVQFDVWAAPQIVVTVSGPDSESIARCLEQNSSRLKNAMEQAERNRVIQNAIKYEEPGIRRAVSEQYDGSPYFPKGYVIRKQSDGFFWIAYETTYTNQGVFIYSFPYKDTSDINVKNIIARRNEVLEKQVPGPRENTYMTTNMTIFPSLEWIQYRGRTFAEVRGLWDVNNDFMGGPFVSHVFFDKKQENIIVMEAFVYAPRYEKRNYLRQVESILYSFEWKEE